MAGQCRRSDANESTFARCDGIHLGVRELAPFFVRQLAAVFTAILFSGDDASKLAAQSGSKLPHFKSTFQEML